MLIAFRQPDRELYSRYRRVFIASISKDKKRRKKIINSTTIELLKKAVVL